LVFEGCKNLKKFEGKFATDNGRCLIKDNVIISYANASGAEYTIPDSVTKIGDWVFIGCTSLTSVTISDSVTSIGKYAFNSCTALKSVTIPDSVTSIGGNAFSNCTSLTSVTIPDSVTEIGGWVFSDCTSLIDVYCKATTPPTATGGLMFDDNALDRKIYVPAESVELYKGADWWSNYADYIVGYNFETGEVVPETPVRPANNEIWYTSSDGSVVTPYATDAFGANIVSNVYENGMGIITFDGEVTEIGDEAFAFCTSLTNVTIPDSVTKLGDNAFYYCASLTSVTIPDSVTKIGGYAFYYCISLTSVTIHDSVTAIGNWAFRNCTSLTSVTIPDSVTEIGIGAFDSCTSLTSVIIGNSVTSIGKDAFSRCSSLTSVTIGDSVTTIGNYAFYYCESLKSVYCKATTPPSLGESYVFDHNASGRTIFVPAASVEAYKTAYNWSEYADAIVGYNF